MKLKMDDRRFRQHAGYYEEERRLALSLGAALRHARTVDAGDHYAMLSGLIENADQLARYFERMAETDERITEELLRLETTISENLDSLLNRFQSLLG